MTSVLSSKVWRVEVKVPVTKVSPTSGIRNYVVGPAGIHSIVVHGSRTTAQGPGVMQVAPRPADVCAPGGVRLPISFARPPSGSRSSISSVAAPDDTAVRQPGAQRRGASVRIGEVSVVSGAYDGTGLPPAALARLERARSSGVASSLLSVPGHVGVDLCGLYPVGEVMGCIVQHIGWSGYGGCGWFGYGYAPVGTITSGSGRQSGWAGFGPYADALNHGFDTAIVRMLTEARELGGDGVVDVRITQTSLGNDNREFLAMGTAVRSSGTTHLKRPFATTLDGQDMVKLLTSGWVPAGIAVGISVGIRHDDYQTRLAARAWTTNIEVPGYTELLNDVRADCRRQFARRVAGFGAEGAILSEPVRTSVHEIEPGENHLDHVAEGWMLGTAIARFDVAADFGTTRPPVPLVLPLSGTLRPRPTTRGRR